MEEKSLEEQIAELREQIEVLKNEGASLAPARQIQRIRTECRDRYFGTRDEVRHGDIQYGPSGKTYSDYGIVMEIINKVTGLLFKYSRGRAQGNTQITNLVRTMDDLEDYRAICDGVCRDLRAGIDKFTRSKKGQTNET